MYLVYVYKIVFVVFFNESMFHVLRNVLKAIHVNHLKMSIFHQTRNQIYMHLISLTLCIRGKTYTGTLTNSDRINA